MMSHESIAASSRRVVTIAVRRAAEICHRDDYVNDSDASALVRDAYDFLRSKGVHHAHKDPLFARSLVQEQDEGGAAEIHLSELVRFINLKDHDELIRIIAVRLSHEMSVQLRSSGHHRATSTVVQLIRATA